MEFRQLGNSGLTVSLLGLGCNNFGGRCDLERSREVINTALEAGINFFDTADVYGNRGGSEAFMGKILKGRRDEIVLATKFGLEMGTGERSLGSRRYIKAAVEASLRRLDTDRIDLYQLHTPDLLTPLEETLTALDDLVREGKVLYIGSSNFAGWQVADADHLARELGTQRFISIQNHYNVLDRALEDEVIPAAKHFGIGILPYYPLEAGLLTGKFTRGANPPKGTRLASRPQILECANFDLIEELCEFAKEQNMELIDLAFAYLYSEETVSSVIAGATSKEQVLRNVRSLDHQLGVEELAELDEILGQWDHLKHASRTPE